MDVSATLIELKPDTANLVEDWKAFIEKHLDLAVDSIANEGVIIESWFLVQIWRQGLLALLYASKLYGASHWCCK